MPKLIAEKVDRERFYMDDINTCLERDIKELALMGKLGAFYDFLVFSGFGDLHVLLSISPRSW